MGDRGVESLEPLPSRGNGQHSTENDCTGEQDEKNIRAHGQHVDAQSIESVEMCI